MASPARESCTLREDNTEIVKNWMEPVALPKKMRALMSTAPRHAELSVLYTYWVVANIN